MHRSTTLLDSSVAQPFLQAKRAFSTVRMSLLNDTLFDCNAPHTATEATGNLQTLRHERIPRAPSASDIIDCTALASPHSPSAARKPPSPKGSPDTRPASNSPDVNRDMHSSPGARKKVIIVKEKMNMKDMVSASNQTQSASSMQNLAPVAGSIDIHHDGDPKNGVDRAHAMHHLQHGSVLEENMARLSHSQLSMTPSGSLVGIMTETPSLIRTQSNQGGKQILSHVRHAPPSHHPHPNIATEISSSQPASAHPKHHLRDNTHSLPATNDSLQKQQVGPHGQQLNTNGLSNITAQSINPATLNYLHLHNHIPNYSPIQQQHQHHHHHHHQQQQQQQHQQRQQHQHQHQHQQHQQQHHYHHHHQPIIVDLNTRPSSPQVHMNHILSQGLTIIHTASGSRDTDSDGNMSSHGEHHGHTPGAVGPSMPIYHSNSSQGYSNFNHQQQAPRYIFHQPPQAAIPAGVGYGHLPPQGHPHHHNTHQSQLHHAHIHAQSLSSHQLHSQQSSHIGSHHGRHPHPGSRPDHQAPSPNIIEIEPPHLPSSDVDPKDQILMMNTMQDPQIHHHVMAHHQTKAGELVLCPNEDDPSSPLHLNGNHSFFWKDTETRFLITLVEVHYIPWKDKQIKRGINVDVEDRCFCINFKSSEVVWTHIADLMKESGFNRSSRQCQTKWSNLTQGYKIQVSRAKCGGRGTVTLEYRDMLETIFASRRYLTHDFFASSIGLTHGNSSVEEHTQGQGPSIQPSGDTGDEISRDVTSGPQQDVSNEDDSPTVEGDVESKLSIKSVKRRRSQVHTLSNTGQLYLARKEARYDTEVINQLFFEVRQLNYMVSQVMHQQRLIYDMFTQQANTSADLTKKQDDANLVKKRKQGDEAENYNHQEKDPN